MAHASDPSWQDAKLLTADCLLPTHIAVLDALGIREPILLGEGGEGLVFAYGGDRVVKIYKGATREYLESLADFQGMLACAGLPYRTPRIERIESRGDVYYTIEPRLPGSLMSAVFGSLTPHQKRRLLARFLEALAPLHAIAVSHRPFGQVLQLPETLTAGEWPAFLLAKLDQRLAGAHNRLRQDIAGFDARLAAFKEKLAADPPAAGKHIVHGDHFPENVLVDSDLRISALMDFSPHTVVGDYRMDVVGAIVFLELLDDFGPEDTDYLNHLALSRYGDTLARCMDTYRLYYSLYLADSCLFDPRLYAWCLRNLTSHLPE